jgi:hypothetical protein
MDKKIAGLLGAVATLGTFGSAQATPATTPDDVLRANSYAELLQPIPNAVALLQAIDEAAPPAKASENVQLAQFYYHHHHHHHHHHAFYPRYRYYDYDAPVVVVPRYRRYYHHHHHHHHHHHSFYRRDY